MTTHKTIKATSASPHSHAAPSTEPTQSNPSATAAAVILQKPPPANALIPSPPTGFVPSSDSIFLGFLPRLVELGALPGAVEDLKGFADYAATLGTTAPPLAEVLAAFDLADQWSTIRKASSIWDTYAQMQEGIAWATVRPLMDSLRPAFELAAAHNPSLPTKFASLNTLLTAKQSIAKKGASTRALNRQAVAAGKPPIHGKAGKRRLNASNKAIVAAAAAANGAASVPPAPPQTSPPVAPAPGVPTPAAPSPAPPPAAEVSTATNGNVAHS